MSEDSSCCAIDQSHKKCVDLSYDDSHCAKLAECCVGVHDPGLHRKCISRVRECRKLGNAFDPMRKMKPMDTRWLFTDKPGYTTQGQLVLENFGGMGGLSIKCVAKSVVVTLIVAYLLKMILKTNISNERVVGIAVLAALVHCMLKSMQ